MAEELAYRLDERHRRGLIPACFMGELVERLQAGDREGACDAVEGLEDSVHRQSNAKWRERTASKRALMRVEKFLGNPVAYETVKMTVAWLLEDRASELFARCAQKLLSKGVEAVHTGDRPLGLAYRQLAVVLVGEDEVMAISEEERFTFAFTPVAPPVFSRPRASFAR